MGEMEGGKGNEEEERPIIPWQPRPHQGSSSKLASHTRHIFPQRSALFVLLLLLVSQQAGTKEDIFLGRWCLFVSAFAGVTPGFTAPAILHVFLSHPGVKVMK